MSDIGLTEKGIIAHQDSQKRAKIVKDVRNARKGSLSEVSVTKDWWPTSKSRSQDYSDTFEDLIRDSFIDGVLSHKVINPSNHNVLKNYVEDLKTKRGKVRILDLMGYGAVLRDLGVEGVAVGLRDRRTPQEKQEDQEKGRGFIEGDINLPKTWKDIENYLKMRGEQSKFDIILCRPIGALNYIPRNPNLYKWFLNNIYKLLNSNNGIFLTQSHWRMTSHVKKACEELNQIPGVYARYKRPLIGIGRFMLVRQKNAPEELKN